MPARIDQSSSQLSCVRSIEATYHTQPGAPVDKDRLTRGPAAELDITLAARRCLQDLPPVRDARVAAVRRRLQAGTFRVKAEALADRIIGQ